MAGKISIGELNAKVTANAKPYIDALKELEQATRKSSGGMNKEWEQFKRKMGRTFGAADIGKSILSGLGIGSGFALAQQAMEQLSGHFKAAAEAAEDMAKSTERQLELTKQLISLRRTDAQNLDQMKRDMAELDKKRADLLKSTTTTRTIGGTIRGESYRREINEVTPPSAANRKRADELAVEMAELGVKIETAEKKLREAEKTGSLAQQTENVKRVSRDQELLAAAIAKTVEATDKLDERQEEEKERLLDLADANRVYLRALEKVHLQEAAGFLTAEQAGAVRRALTAEHYRGMAEEVEDIVAVTEKASAAAEELGFTFSSAFEDAIVMGGNLRDVLRGLAQDVSRILVRNTITKPMAEWLTASIGAFAFGGAKAGGGSVSGGTPYMVGERGPELFVPSSSGTVMTASQTAAAGSGGPAMTFVYNIASGVTRAELKPLLDQQRAKLRAEVPDMVRRGGAYRNAFA